MSPSARQAVAAVLRQCREEAGLSRDALARQLAPLIGAASVSAKRVYRWEKAEAPLPSEFIGPLSAVLGLEPAEFASRIEAATRE